MKEYTKMFDKIMVLDLMCDVQLIFILTDRQPEENLGHPMEPQYETSAGINGDIHIQRKVLRERLPCNPYANMLLVVRYRW